MLNYECYTEYNYTAYGGTPVIEYTEKSCEFQQSLSDILFGFSFSILLISSVLFIRLIFNVFKK